MITAVNYRELALKKLPPISPMVMRLIGKLARTDVDFDEIARLIDKDALLCGQILKAVNSASFARGAQINRVPETVIRLGISKLRKLALSLTVSNIFGSARPAKGWSPLRFNLHSAAVAILSEAIAAEVTVASGEGVFVAALLHDVGKFAIAVNLPREYSLILQMCSSSGRHIAECERELLGFDHAELGGIMLARWELPAALQQAVYYHHKSEPAEDGSLMMSQVLQAADSFVRYLSITVEQTATDKLPDNRLEIPGVELPTAKILGVFETEYAELKELFH